MKLKFVWKMLRKPRKQVQKCCRVVGQFLQQNYQTEIGEQNGNVQLEVEEEHIAAEIMPIISEEEEETRMAAVLSNEYYQNGLMDSEELYQTMCSSLDAIFRRHFLRNADQFALANVESMHCARKRQRQFQLIKELLAEMIEHWEEAQHKRQCRRQFGDSNQWMNDIGVHLFMDTYFGTFWDFLMKCSQTLEWAFPNRELTKKTNMVALKSMGNKNRRRNCHTIYGPLTSTMISEEKEGDKSKILDFNLEFNGTLFGTSMETKENVVGNGIEKNCWPIQIKGQMKERRNKRERPKSAAIYLF